MPESYDIRQVANRLGVRTRTVREWIRQGKLKGFKYGISNKWFVSAEELDRIEGSKRCIQ